MSHKRDASLNGLSHFTQPCVTNDTLNESNALLFIETITNPTFEGFWEEFGLLFLISLLHGSFNVALFMHEIINIWMY